MTTTYALSPREQELLVALVEAADVGLNKVEAGERLGIDKHAADIFLHMLRGAHLTLYSNEKDRYYINAKGLKKLERLENQPSLPGMKS